MSVYLKLVSAAERARNTAEGHIGTATALDGINGAEYELEAAGQRKLAANAFEAAHELANAAAEYAAANAMNGTAATRMISELGQV